MKKRFVITAVWTLCAAAAVAQTSRQEVAGCPDKAGGVYYAYPVADNAPLAGTPAPNGYKPFYISHYGRHGSRYLISDRDYADVTASMHKAADAGALTPLGHDVLQRLDTILEEGRGRGGELSPLGVRQHRAIARRMHDAHPQVFAPGADVTARSTTVMRCAHSMFAFIEALKEKAPYLDIPRESGERDMYYLNFHTPESGAIQGKGHAAYTVDRSFKTRMTRPARLVGSLFADSVYVSRHIDPDELMWQLYWVAVDLQNMETTVRLYDIFTPDELFDLWQSFNFHMYSRNTSYPPARGLHTDNAKNLLRHIVDNADSYISSGRHGATLRFGHDGNIIPLAALMRLPGCTAYQSNPDSLYADYADFKVSPMAANLQIVFYRNDAGRVLAKVMMNEREMALPGLTPVSGPYYSWPDMRAYFVDILSRPSADYIPSESK